MDHREAIQTMASERYLLGELSPQQRDAYEEHLFECVECANDALLGAAFVDGAKAVLPTMQTSSAARRPAGAKSESFNSESTRRDWFSWLRPAIMVPFFATLIAVIGYQNLVTYPALELAANEPRILPAATVLHGETRSAIPVVYADLVQGSAIAVEIPGGANYASYKFEFYNSAGKLIYTRVVPSSQATQDTQTIFLPGSIKQDTYKLSLSGISSTGETVAIQQQFFEVQHKRPGSK